MIIIMIMIMIATFRIESRTRWLPLILGNNDDTARPTGVVDLTCDLERSVAAQKIFWPTYAERQDCPAMRSARRWPKRALENQGFRVQGSSSSSNPGTSHFASLSTLHQHLRFHLLSISFSRDILLLIHLCRKIERMNMCPFDGADSLRQLCIFLLHTRMSMENVSRGTDEAK